MYDSLPSELKKHKAWLVWRFKPLENGKKPLKMPYYTEGSWRKGEHGSRDDRQKLATFDAALGAKAKGKGRYEGLGFALLADWNLVAVDFDDCVTDGEVLEAVYDLVKDSYWEFSPSGNGVRAFFIGHVRDAKSINKEVKAKRGYGVEFFCNAGFVTITGNVSDEVELCGNQIVPLTPRIKALYDEAIGSRDADTDNADQAVVGMTDDEIKRMLESWDADCDYETWLNVGMAIHHETRGDGFELWHEWSAQGSKYEGQSECEYKWESFGRAGKKSLKTIRWMINEKGLDFTLENAVGSGELGGKLAPLVDLKTGKTVEPGIPKGLKVGNNGLVEPTMTHLRLALGHPFFSGWQFKKDTFLLQTLVAAPGADEWRLLQDEDYAELMVMLERKLFDRPAMEKIRQALALVARDNEENSAQHWLENIIPAWDGVERIHRFAQDVLGATDDEAYVQAVSTYAWTAHAGRVLKPGCKADMMPVLIGPEKVGKSTNVGMIAPDSHMRVTLKFSDDEKANAEKTVGVLVAEIAELDGMTRKEVGTIKDFISRQEEKCRFAYARNPTTIPRTFLLWGTSNDEEFLVSTTGNRRFLPMHVIGTGDKRFTPEERDMLWAEARDKFKSHGVMCADEANDLAIPFRDRARVTDNWESVLQTALIERTNGDGSKLGERPWLAVEEVLEHAFGVPVANQDKRVEARAREALKCNGYVSKPMWVTVAGKKVKKRVWIKQNEKEDLV